MKLNVFNRKKTALEKLTSTYEVKLDVSDSKTVKKLVSIMKQAYKEYTREYTAIVKDIYILMLQQN